MLKLESLPSKSQIKSVKESMHHKMFTQFET